MANETAKVTIELGGSGTQAKEAIASVKSELESLTAVAERVTAHLDRVAKVAEYAGLGFSNWRAIMTGGIAIFSFEQLIRGAMDFDKSVYTLSATLNNDAMAASQWIGVAKEMGANSDMLARSFATFDRNASSNKDTLKQMGVDVEGLRRGTISLNDAILQSADFFKAHAGASQNAELATTIFGRSGKELLPVLQLGRDGIKLITDELQRYGLVMNNATLSQQMAFVFQIQQGEMAVKGLAIQLGNALLPGIAALMQGLSRLIQDHLPQFLAGVQRIVSYIIGFVEGLTGMNMAVDDSAMALGNLTQNTGGYGDSVDTATGSTKAMTQALQDQIKALQEVQAAQDFADRMKQLNQTVADDKLAVGKLSRELNWAILEGDYLKAVQINDQLVKAKQKQGNDEATITKDTNKQQTQSKIDALQDQIRAIEEANQRGVASMLAAGNTMAANFGQAGVDAASKFKFAMDGGAEATGKSAGLNFGNAFAGFINNPSNLAAFGKLGEAVGNAIGNGIFTAIGQSFENWKNQNIGNPLQNLIINAMKGQGLSFNNPNNFNPTWGGFQNSTYDPNWNPNSSGADASRWGGGGNRTNNVHVTINGATDPYATAAAVNDALSRHLGAF